MVSSYSSITRSRSGVLSKSVQRQHMMEFKPESKRLLQINLTAEKLVKKHRLAGIMSVIDISNIIGKRTFPLSITKAEIQKIKHTQARYDELQKTVKLICDYFSLHFTGNRKLDALEISILNKMQDISVNSKDPYATVSRIIDKCAIHISKDSEHSFIPAILKAIEQVTGK